MVVEYGVERKIFRYSVLGVVVSVGVLQGVFFKVKFNRVSQIYFFFIYLMDQFLFSVMFYVIVGFLVVYFVMYCLIIKLYFRVQKEKELEKQRESVVIDVLQKK